jgi:hypothetical protein
MSNPRIEVDVVANVAGVASGVSAATSQLDKLGKAAQSAAPPIESLAKATSRYNGIGIDFARVIQDAPFGIIGVGNNIQQLAQSFSSLGNVGDSTTSKLKLAFSQIVSSGNLLVLAVSAITTVWTLYEKGAFKSEDATKSLREQLEKYRETLNGVTKANLEGQISAQKELSNLKLLQIQAENTSLSQQKRNQAVDELQKQYPEYLKGLTDEQIKTGQVGEAYNKLTSDIVALSKAKALSAELDKQAGDLLTLRLQEEQRANEILQLREKLQVAINNKVDAGARVAGQFTAENDDAMIIQMNIDKLIKEQLKSADQRNKIIKEQLFIESQIVEQNSLGANFVKKTGKEIDANKEKLEKYSAGWDDYNLKQETAKILQDKLTVSSSEYEKQILKVLTKSKEPIVPEVTGDNAWDQYTFSVYQFQKASFEANKEITETSKKALEFGERIKGLENKEIKIKTTVEGIPDEKAGPTPFENFIDSIALAVDKLPEFEQRVAEFAFNIADILDANIYEAFANLGNALGEALATGGNVLSALGKSLLSSVGKLLGDFGKQLIAFGVAGLAYSSLIKSIFTDPVTAAPKAGLAIAAGVALVAISGAIGASMKSNSSGGGGGSGAGGGSAAPAGSTFTGGGVGGLFAQNRDLNGELVVRGQDLVYVFGQANDRINKG